MPIFGNLSYQREKGLSKLLSGNFLGDKSIFLAYMSEKENPLQYKWRGFSVRPPSTCNVDRDYRPAGILPYYSVANIPSNNF